MVEQKVTLMELKVDLDCPKCYKKVKKILCQSPEIRDQEYDKQKNLVRIFVLCCSPERIRDKLCCKGRQVIQSIDIVDLPKPIIEPPKKNPPKDKPNPNPPQQTPSTTGPGCGGLVPWIPPPPGTFPCGPQCFHGYGGGWCYCEYCYWWHVPPSPPPPSPPCSCGCGCGCDYHCEENTPSCTIL